MFFFLRIFNRSSVNKLILKWQSLYAQKQIRDQTLEQYTTSYITDKLVPMWPDGWMKFNDIQSHFMPKPKVKDPKVKPANDVKPSKPFQPTVSAQPTLPILDTIKDSVMMAHSVEKKKSHTHKDPSKLIKNANDKPTLPKTDKKHLQHPLSTPVSSLLSLPMADAFNVKPVMNILPLDSKFKKKNV